MVFVILTAGALPLVAAFVGAVFFAMTFVGIAVFFAAAFLVANDLSQSVLRSRCGIASVILTPRPMCCEVHT